MPGSVLVVIDVQERLFKAMDSERRDDMIRHVKILCTAARHLGVPIILTEQYPRGLGRTLPELSGLLEGVTPIEKTAFSCWEASGFPERVRTLGAEHLILVGIEAHVCVLLTALDAVAAGLRVSLVADAVCSRRSASLDIGLAQARHAGVMVTSTETVLFRLLGRADTDAFRDIAALLR